MANAEQEASFLAEALARFGLSESQRLADVSWRGEDERPCFLPGGPVPHELHGAIYDATAAEYIVGLHTSSAKAAASSLEGIRCLSQSDVCFYNSVAACDGSAVAARQALQAMPGAVALAAGSTLYVFGASPGAAFTLAFYASKACKKQLLIGANDVLEADEGAIAGAQKLGLSNPDFAAGVEWPAVKDWLRGADVPALQTSNSSEERALKQKLSIAHKELNRRGLDELVWNHCSAKFRDGFLITPGYMLWERMEPDDIIQCSGNVTANVLHQAVYASVPSAASVIHTHSLAIEAVSCLRAGLVEPPGSEFVGRVAYHDYEGISTDDDEFNRLCPDIQSVPNCTTIMMRNHGAITFGASVEEALERMLALDAACREQLLATGAPSMSPAQQTAREIELAALRDDSHWKAHRPWASKL